jgi:two-component system, NarL family, sensor kinase
MLIRISTFMNNPSSLNFFMIYFVRYVFVMWFCFALMQTNAQTHFIDSLENELKKGYADTTNVLTIVTLANQYSAYDTLKAYQTLEKGYALAKKLNWNYAWAQYYQNKAVIKQNSVHSQVADQLFDTAIFYYRKAVNENRNNGEVKNAKLSIAECKGSKGDIILKQGKSKEAIAIYIEALEAWKASDDPEKMVAVGIYYSRIATVYYDLNQYDKALEYDKLSLSCQLLKNNEEAIAWAYVYMCDDFYSLKQPDSALVYLAKAKPMVEKLNNHRLNLQYLGKLAVGKKLKNDFAGAIVEYQKIIDEAKIIDNNFQLFTSQKMIGFCNLKLGNLIAARKYFLMALPPAIEGGFIKEKIEILQNLVTIEEQSGHPKEAFTYLKELTVIKDSMSKEASNKAIAEIENKYQASQKEKEIIQLQKDKEVQVLSMNHQTLAIKQKSTWNYFLASVLILVLAVGFFGFRNFRNRQQLSKQQDQLKEQRIRELEKDKQLIAVDSMLKGQEEERTRLAKDLHDGLGGMLSGVKFSLMNMKSNLIVDHENVIVFERSLDMLDTSIQELRRVAHNMMPATLIKFGLDEALKDYCNNINNAQILQVKYQSFGMEERIDSNVEIIIYRIVQELFANIFKHAKATEALVQLLREGDRISIAVEDNGKGFDVEELKSSKGSGWANIRSRVDYLKGKLDLNSEIGKGTSVNIEIHA